MKFQLLFTKIIFELYLKFVERCLPNEQNQSLGERNRGPITLDLHFSKLFTDSLNLPFLGLLRLALPTTIICPQRLLRRVRCSCGVSVEVSQSHGLQRPISSQCMMCSLHSLLHQ